MKSNVNIEEFRQRLIDRFDLYELLEVMDYTVEDFWDVCAEKIMDDPDVLEELGVDEITE